MLKIFILSIIFLMVWFINEKTVGFSSITMTFVFIGVATIIKYTFARKTKNKSDKE